MVAPALALALGAGAFGLGSAFGGGGGPSVGDVFNEIRPFFGPGGPAHPQTGPFPEGSVTTPGGGGVKSADKTFLNFNKTPGLLNQLLSGKGKAGGKMTPGNLQSLREAVQGSPTGIIEFDQRLLGPGIRSKLNKKGAIDIEPGTELTASPGSQGIFDFLQNAEMDRIAKQSMFNDSVLMPLIGQLAGFQGNAIGNANRLANQGFTELDPTMQGKVDSAKQAFFNNAKTNLSTAFNQDLGSVNQLLATQGVPLGRSSDSMDFFKQQLLEPYTKQLGSLAEQTEIQGRQFANDIMANQRAGYGAYLQSPSMNAATAGLQVPEIPFNQTFINPTDQFDPSLVSNMYQYQNQFGLSRDQLRQAPYLAALPSAIQAGMAPGFGSALGGAAGSILPLMALNSSKTALPGAAGGFDWSKLMGLPGNMFNTIFSGKGIGG